MPKMKNHDVVVEFFNSRGNNPQIESHTGNLYGYTGNRLMNYRTCLAQFVDGILVINTTKYSRTTSTIQTCIKRELLTSSCTVKFVEGVPMNTRDLTKYVISEVTK